MTHYLKPYQDAAKEFGGTFKATLWRSTEGQQLRFKAFCSLVNFDHSSILDVGCGIGDFAQFLLTEDVRFKLFHGVDALDEMIQTAITKNLPKTTFSTEDVLLNPLPSGDYDWITYSGTLNTMPEKRAMDLIDTSFKKASIGVIFNFLSNQSHRDENKEDLGPARRFNTVKWLQFALSKTPLVAFNQAFLKGHDATILMKKPS
jgi:SAM-dependent methyltransferase